MKKVMQIVFVLMVLICIYHYTKSEATISLARELEKKDYAGETDREIENETEKENGNIEFVCGEYFYTDDQTIWKYTRNDHNVIQ